MKRLITTTFQFYKLTIIYNITFTLLTIVLMGLGGMSLNPLFLLQVKVIGFLSATALYSYAANKTFYYFRNTGFLMRHVILRALLLDFILGAIAISLISLFAYAIVHFKS